MNIIRIIFLGTPLTLPGLFRLIVNSGTLNLLDTGYISTSP
jgi:hypothetical protein